MMETNQGEIALSIIIVNYNGKRFLADCLDSIARHIPCPHEVIMVDNASIDESCAFIREHYPAVRLIESPINTGFTGGNNLGARSAKGPLLLLLNNDTKLLSDIVPAMNEFEDATLGVLGCRLFYGDGRQQLSFGYDHTPLRLILSWLGLGALKIAPTIFQRNQIEHLAYEYPHPCVAWVSGAFLLTRKTLWNRLEGLDESYFMYVEDVDYCKRIRDMGYRVAYSPSVQVTHYEGAGKVWIGAKALSDTMNSYLIYTRKFYGPTVVGVLRMALVAVMLSRALIYALRSTITSSSVVREKRQGYMSASRQLLKSRN